MACGPSSTWGTEVNTTVEDVWRDEWGRLLALLVARYRRLDLAEDGLGDAFEAATRTWPTDGPPANPAGTHNRCGLDLLPARLGGGPVASRRSLGAAAPPSAHGRSLA